MPGHWVCAHCLLLPTEFRWALALGVDKLWIGNQKLQFLILRQPAPNPTRCNFEKIISVGKIDARRVIVGRGEDLATIGTEHRTGDRIRMAGERGHLPRHSI